jgi:hypothetical protein
MKTKIFSLLFVAFIMGNCLIISAQAKVEKWKMFEMTLKGPKTGNPFTEVELKADFQQGGMLVPITGFYDGEGKYVIRFMPQAEGEWEYVTKSNIKALNGKKGKLICTPASTGNHGPVVVKDSTYLAYADGTPHYSFGTTCYAWLHQGDSIGDLTIKTLSNGYFNKLRMCIFPKDYDWNKNEPFYYPFEGKPLTEWDYMRFKPVYFRNIEKRIRQLDSLGIQADLIVFHPYDRWGFKRMDIATDERYIRYIIARFSAFKNVWWSMANEYDLMMTKKLSDWEFYLKLFAENDPYNHLRSIHNWRTIYTEGRYITHLSVQNEETFRARELMMKYRKPVVFDECRYEGNIPRGWGDITPQEMTNKFWRGFINGGHVGHGETILTNDLTNSAILWWSKGGTLKGESYKRIKFLKDIIDAAPGFLVSSGNRLSYKDEYFLIYITSVEQPILASVNLPAEKKYKVEIIDTWNMTINTLLKVYSGNNMIELPGKPGIALRITVIK